MFLRQFIQSVLGLVFLVSSSLALSNTEFTYNVIDGGIELTGCVDGCPSDLFIPAMIDGYSVTEIGDFAFQDNQLETLSFSQNIPFITIGVSAFENNKLTSLNISDTSGSIKDWAFKRNELADVKLSDDIVYQYSSFDINTGQVNEDWQFLVVNENIFIMGCIKCPSDLIIPNEINSKSVIGIGAFAFRDMALNSLYLPDSLRSIGAVAFGNNQLTTITIPQNVEIIYNYAFVDNQLTTINFLGAPYSWRNDTQFDNNPIIDIYVCRFESPWVNLAIEGIVPIYIENCDSLMQQSNFVNYATFDIDQSGSVDALSDGLILLRYFFGLRGDSLINNVISPNATRTSAADIEAYIESHMP